MESVGFYLLAALSPLGGSLFGTLFLMIVLLAKKVRDHSYLAVYQDAFASRLLLMILALSALSVMFSPSPSFSLTVVLGQVIMVAFGLVAARFLVQNELSARRSLLIVAVALLLSAIFVLANPQALVRARTLGAGINATGTLLVLFAGITLPFLWSQRTKWGYGGAVVLFGTVLLAILATKSRGALLGFVGLSTVLLGFNKKGFIGLAVFLVILASLVATNQDYLERFTRLGFAENIDRLHIWEASLKMMESKPILGVGPGNFPFVYEDYRPGEEYRKSVAYAHNIFLQVGAEYGLPALTAFAALMLLVFYYAVKLALTGSMLYRGLLASFVGVMIHQQVDITAWGAQVGVLFWLLNGLIIALYVKEFRIQGAD